MARVPSPPCPPQSAGPRPCSVSERAGSTWTLWDPPQAACCLAGLRRRNLRPCRPPGSSGPGSRALLLPVPIGSAAVLARDVLGRRFCQLPGPCWGRGDATCHEGPSAQSSPASRTVHLPRVWAGKVKVLTQGFPPACGPAGAGHVTRAPPPHFCPEPAGLAGWGPVGEPGTCWATADSPSPSCLMAVAWGSRSPCSPRRTPPFLPLEPQGGDLTQPMSAPRSPLRRLGPALLIVSPPKM